MPIVQTGTHVQRSTASSHSAMAERHAQTTLPPEIPSSCRPYHCRHHHLALFFTRLQSRIRVQQQCRGTKETVLHFNVCSFTSGRASSLTKVLTTMFSRSQKAPNSQQMPSFWPHTPGCPRCSHQLCTPLRSARGHRGTRCPRKPNATTFI